MAGILTVQTIQGPTSGANANKVIIPAGQTLDASAGGVTLPAGVGGQVVQFKQLYNSNTAVSFSSVSGTQLGSMDFYYPINARIGGSFTKTFDAATSYVIVGGHYFYRTEGTNVHDFWVWKDGDESNGIHLGDDIVTWSSSSRYMAKISIDACFTNLGTGTHTIYAATGAGDTRVHSGVLNYNPATTWSDMSNHTTRSAMWLMEVLV
jgi:hypothetical protein